MLIFAPVAIGHVIAVVVNVKKQKVLGRQNPVEGQKGEQSGRGRMLDNLLVRSRRKRRMRRWRRKGRRRS